MTTIKELRELIAGLDDNVVVILARDAKGNGVIRNGNTSKTSS